MRATQATSAHPAWVMSIFGGYPTWITLPGPPHAKKRHRGVRGGHVYKPDAAQERAIALGVRSQWRGPRIDGPAAVYAVFWLPNLRTKDLDNLIKALLDGCNAAGIWGDDRQVEWLVSMRGVDRENPRTELAVGVARR